MMDALKEAKADVRKNMEEKLSNLTTNDRKFQSDIVVGKLLSLPTFQKSKRISTFLSIDNEIDTEPILRKIFEEGKECFVPRYSKTGMEMVKLHSMEDWETLPKTKWGIKQPRLSDQRENALETGGLDFIVMPGVAFTVNGDRLGHGAGHYDQYLTKIKQLQTTPPATVAVAFKEQIVDELPLSERDVTIDLVLFAD